MANSLTFIEPLNLKDVNGIEKWHNRFRLYTKINKDITEDNLTIYYLTMIGKESYDLLVDLAFPKDLEKLKMDDLEKILIRHVKPVNFEATERAKFHSIIRHPEEKLRDFLLRLQQQAAKCTFGNQLEINLRDRIVAGVNNPNVQRKLLSIRGLTFHEAKEILEDCDDVSSAVSVNDQPQAQVLYNGSQSHKPRNNRSKGGYDGSTFPRANKPELFKANNSNRNFNKTTSNPQIQSQNLGACFSCGGQHLRSKCRFRDAVCNQCKRKGHIQRVCRQKIIQARLTQYDTEDDNLTNNFRDLRMFTSEDQRENENCDREEYLQALSVNSVQNDHIHERLTFSTGRSDDFIVDTGSPINFMPINRFKEMGYLRSDLRPTNAVIRGVSGHNLPVLGESMCDILQGTQVCSTKFIITSEGPSVLGLEGLRRLNLNIVLVAEPCPKTDNRNKVTSSSSVSVQNNELPSEIKKIIHSSSVASGGMRISPVNLQCSQPPKFLNARPLAFGIRDGVHREIQNLVSEGILSPVKTSSWATPIVAVRKPNGSFRICGDYSVTANQSLKLTSFTTPGMEEMLTDFQGCSYFSKIDLTNAFLQIPLSESAKEITTINTIWGLFSYNFLPFGLNISPGIFQQTINSVIQGLDGVKAYQDDLLVFASTQSEHDRRLLQLLKRLDEFNVKINAKKSCFNVKEVHYLGHVINEKGISPDKDKITAVADAPKPTNHKELRSFLGFLQYYSKFVPHFSSKAEPLFQLSTQSDFEWNKLHDACFNGLVEEVVNGITLQSYNPNSSSRVIVDASEVGLGAILEQNDLPILCISRRLNKAERGYSQTQKEALAIKWAVTRLHKYLFGCLFTIVTDHKALEYLFCPSRAAPKATSNMLQRWALDLSAYNYTIEHKPGKRIPHADYLSRYSKFAEVENDDSVQNECFSVNPLPFDRNRLIEETRSYYGQVLSGIRNGWSLSAKKRFPDLFKHREELSITVDHIIMMQDKFLIPPSCRKMMLEHLHEGHLGRDKMKSLARMLCWWPSLNADIVSFSKDCVKCQNSKPNTHPRWTSWPHTYEPMARVHVDYCGPFLGQYHALVVEDSYSKYPEVYFTKSATAEFTQFALRKFFSREGIPKVLVSDNGSHFTEKSLKEWLKTIGVIQLFTAPRHPCSNGLAERFVQTLKTAIRSCDISNFKDLDRYVDNFLMQYRNAEHSSTRKSPAFLFKGRNLRTSLALDTTEVMFYRGGDSRPASGVILRQIGNRMVEIIDEDDGTMHRRHVDQIHISKPSPKPSQTSSITPISDIHNDNVPNESSQEVISDPCSSAEIDQGISTDSYTPSTTSTRPKRNVKRPNHLNDYVLR